VASATFFICSNFSVVEKMQINWKKIPFDPKRIPFFYGWIIVAASTIGIYASIPGQTMGVGVFTDFLIKALNLTRTELSTAYMIGTIASSFFLPFAGKMLDQIGSRVMVVLVSIGLGLSLLFLSFSPQMTQLFPMNSFWVPMFIMSFGFLLLRFFGQGCIALISRVNIGRWFNHRRGLATAIMGVFASFGFNLSPVALNIFVESWGWQHAYWGLAAMVGVGMSVIGWIFYRDNPEQCGLVMDGIDDEDWLKKMSKKIPETAKEFTRKEASRTLSFWAFSLGPAIWGLIITAITFHIASIGTEFGLSRTQAYTVFWPMSFFSVTANFFCSWISDKIRLKWLLLAMMVAQIISLFGLLNFSEFYGRAIFTVFQGLSGGTFFAVSTVVFPRYFGRKHLGAISGLSMSIMVFASAIGPVFFSGVHGLTGSYQAVILGSILLPAIILLASLKADNPQKNII